MTSHGDLVQPPRIAVWLVTLFTPAEEGEAILGDLLEEFSELASKSGAAFARSWYWRQTVKTAAHLASAGIRAAPWSTVAAVAAGYLLIRFGFRLSGQGMGAVLDRYGFYEYLSDLGRQQPSLNIGAAYMFWITRSMLIGRVLVAMLAGGIVAAVAKGSEMTATMTLGLVMGTLGVAGSLMNVATTGSYEFLWTLPWSFAISIAIVAGGAIVRTLRSAATTPPSVT